MSIQYCSIKIKISITDPIILDFWIIYKLRNNEH